MQIEEIDKAVLRKGIRLCTAGLIASYALVVPLRLFNVYPPYLTWLRVIAVPVLFYVQFGALFALPLCFESRWGVPYVVVSLTCILAGLAITWFEQSG
ncbi:MAG: hypothetical protein ACYTGL_14240 [Planctomycetota bacterium]|jgi:hypothetical protein